MILSLFHEVSIRAISAVWLRHARVYRKTWITNCLPPISEPLFYLLGFGFGLRPMIGEVQFENQHIDYVHFLVPGMIAVGVLMQSFFEGVYGTFLRFKYLRVWQAMLAAPLSYGDVFLGDLLWAASKGTLAGIVTGIVSLLCGILTLKSFVCFIPFIVIASIVFGAIGMLSAGLIRSIDEINIPTFLIVVPMPLFCGAYFPRATLPHWMQALFQYLPFSVVVDQMRSIEFNGSTSIVASIILLCCWMIGLVLYAALAIHRRVIS